MSPWEHAAAPVTPTKPSTGWLIGVGVVLVLVAFAVNAATAIFTATWDPGESCRMATEGGGDAVTVRWPAPASVICEGGIQLVPLGVTVVVIVLFAVGCTAISFGGRAEAPRAVAVGAAAALVPTLIAVATAVVGGVAFPSLDLPAAVATTPEPSPARTDVRTAVAQAQIQQIADTLAANVGPEFRGFLDEDLDLTVHSASCPGGVSFSVGGSFTLAPGMPVDLMDPAVVARAEAVRRQIVLDWADLGYTAESDGEDTWIRFAGASSSSVGYLAMAASDGSISVQASSDCVARR